MCLISSSLKRFTIITVTDLFDTERYESLVLKFKFYLNKNVLYVISEANLSMTL